MSSIEPKVIIVDKDDNIIGAEYNLEAKRRGLIRRISRVFLINQGRMFMQKRGPNVDTFPNTWDQSAGGHVDEGETYEQAARRELTEELGIVGNEFYELGKFYLEETYNDIKILEFSMGFAVKYENQKFSLEKGEVSGGEWFGFDEIDIMIKNRPEDFATGFLVAWEKFGNKVKSYK